MRLSSFAPHSALRTDSKGFTLLEVLVALAILGIAITVVLQLFSANLRSIAASEDYISAVTTAEARLRDILDDEELSEKSWSETTSDGYSNSFKSRARLKGRHGTSRHPITTEDHLVHGIPARPRQNGGSAVCRWS